MKVLLTGATGLVGRRLAELLLKEGVVCCAVTRNAESAKEKLHARTQVVEWDGWTDRCGKIDAAINLAGEPIAAGRWTNEQKRRILDSRVSAAQTLVTAIREEKISPKLLINASAVGYYRFHPDRAFTEQDGPGSGFLAEVCTQWEAEADRAAEFGATVKKLRIGMVLSGAGGALGRMLPLFRAGLGGKLGSGRQWMSWIHIDDLAGAIVYLLTNGGPGAYNLTAPNPVTNAEFTRALSKTLRRPAVLPAPAFALRIVLGEMADLVIGSQKVLPEQLLTEGFAFRFGEIENALGDLLENKSLSAGLF